MKHIFLLSFYCFLFLCSGTGYAQVRSSQVDFPPDFGPNSFGHITHISGIGVHSVGTPEERRVADYIFNELSNAGIETSFEKFSFESFDIRKTDLKINGHPVEVSQVCFNPYVGNFQFRGNFILLDSNNTTDSEIADQIVVASYPLTNSAYFKLFFGSPRLILVIPRLAFRQISKEVGRRLVCAIDGDIRKHTSQNVVGVVRGKHHPKNEIILSAHYDSYPGSLGADDNASGVGVLIELARFFRQYQDSLNANIKFVAFGGEEKGLLGSRVYLNRHRQNIANCKLVLNMDQLGGEHIFIETTGGVHGIPEQTGNTQFPEFMRSRSLEGIDSNWRLLAPEVLPLFAISNRPAWLADIIKESTHELFIPVTYVGNTGSDQMTFAQAGVVASAIGTSGNEVHSPKDVPSQVHEQSLVDCGKIVLKIVLKTLER